VEAISLKLANRVAKGRGEEAGVGGAGVRGGCHEQVVRKATTGEKGGRDEDKIQI